MKKLSVMVLAAVAIVGGFIFFTKSPANQTSNNDVGVGMVADVITAANQNTASGHIQSANKKGTVDATDKLKVSIGIGDFFFDPTILKVKNGTTVTWTNSGMIGHDVKTDSNSPKQGPSSELLDRGDTYSFTFDEPGLYLYICSPHPTQMRGVIEVVE